MQDEALVCSLLQRHINYTGSTLAQHILDSWLEARRHILKVYPHDYQAALEAAAKAQVAHA